MKNQVLSIINRAKKPLIVAIDGRAASGKTTLAQELGQELECNVVHMDDFFLQPYQRTEERYARPGGNVDYERFEAEVLLPLSQGKDLTYRPFDCGSFTLGGPIHLPYREITIVEGSYSCHPALWDYYDLHIFLSVDKEEQLRRIEGRNPDRVDMFISKWIPLEELYFNALNIREKCEYIFNT